MNNSVDFKPTPQPRHSPWGAPQRAEEKAPGIWWVSTASHGGFIISEQRHQAMAEPYRSHETFNMNGLAYEEDCDWCCVVLAWPELFSAADVEQARQVYAGWIARKTAEPPDWVTKLTANLNAGRGA